MNEKEILEDIIDTFAFRKGRELWFENMYYDEDVIAFLDKNDDVEAIYKKNEKSISIGIDFINTFDDLSPKRKNDLKKFVSYCGNLVAIGDGFLRFYLYPKEEKVDVVIGSYLISVWEERMKYMRYIIEKASDIDIALDRDKNGMIVFTATYKY